MIRGTQHTQQHRWMASYLDVLTILLIFFVTAAAASLKKVPASPTLPRVESARTVVQDSPGEVLKSVERKLKDEGLDVRQISDIFAGENVAHTEGLVIDLPQAVVFAPGDDRVRREALPALRTIAEALREIPNKVNLAGHADATPIHNRRFRNNWELAAARSLRLMEVLTQRCGIDPSRVSISSYGSLEPKNTNNTSEGRASNRRVEILIYSAR